MIAHLIPRLYSRIARVRSTSLNKADLSKRRVLQQAEVKRQQYRQLRGRYYGISEGVQSANVLETGRRKAERGGRDSPLSWSGFSSVRTDETAVALRLRYPAQSKCLILT
jgi:hypothetical protein